MEVYYDFITAPMFAVEALELGIELNSGTFSNNYNNS
jgi:hypothetical protein